jgi:anti-sigma factor RsiW
MKPVDPWELSGLLDGELDAARAAEVREAIAADPALRAEFERLSKLDGACQRVAAQAAFKPAVDLSASGKARGSESTGIWPLALVALTLLYFLPKAVDMFAAGVALHAVALAVLLWIVCRLNAQSAVYATAR